MWIYFRIFQTSLTFGYNRIIHILWRNIISLTITTAMGLTITTTTSRTRPATAPGTAAASTMVIPTIPRLRTRTITTSTPAPGTARGSDCRGVWSYGTVTSRAGPLPSPWSLVWITIDGWPRFNCHVKDMMYSITCVSIVWYRPVGCGGFTGWCSCFFFSPSTAFFRLVFTYISTWEAGLDSFGLSFILFLVN